MKNKFRIVLLLDRSGSMSSVVKATISGVNELIASTKNIASVLKSDVRLTFIGFEGNDSALEIIPGYEDVSIKKVKEVNEEQIFGRGGTCMYDGMSFMFQKTEKIIKDDEKVLVAVFSDGDTGGDKVSAEEIAQAVKLSKDWTFAFVGANQNAERSATLMGFPKTNAMEYLSDISGTRSAFFRLSRGIRKWMENNVNTDQLKTDDFFNDEDLKQSVMTVNGINLTINMPEAVKGDIVDGHKLPPYAPVPAYVVDEYPQCPSNWEHGSSKASSYFVSAKEGCGMWFDLNGNSSYEYDIAAVLSVQGVNPITGQPTNLPLKLEKYDKKCPLHDEEFKQERFCDKCGFKWPAQNFLSSSGSPRGQFWLDGFRTPDGKVRQYVFTEETARGVAAGIIGEDRVFAIGVAFYRSKNKKPVPTYGGYGGYSGCSGHSGFSGSAGTGYLRGRSLTKSAPSFFSPLSTPQNWSLSQPEKKLESFGEVKTSMSIGGSAAGAAAMDFDSEPADVFASINELASDPNTTIVTHHAVEKDYEVGAGEKINQSIHADPNSLDYWEEEPVGIIYVNYADENAVKRILSAGKRVEVKEGFLAAIPVGN